KRENYTGVIRKNLDIVHDTFGDGRLEGRYPYHNEMHTLDTMRSLKRLIEVWNEHFSDKRIGAREEELLMIAASGHDRIRNGKIGDDEQQSADAVALDMHEAGYHA